MTFAAAGALYFAVVFAAGFGFGLLREMFLMPRLGLFTATLVEAPVMLLASYLAAKWIVARQGGDRLSPAARLSIGLWGLALLLSAEVISSVLLRGTSLVGWLQHFLTAQGALSLALFVAFAAMPALVRGAR